MSVYIDDSGVHNKDSLFVGVEDTAWSRDEINDLIWFSGTGTSTTGFTLPSATAWIVYEVYAVDSHTNDLTDGTNVYAWIEYTSIIGVIATTLETWKTAWESTATTRGYTTYKIKATHYKTGDIADVYYATEAATDFSKTVADGIEDGDFTGYGTWSISDTMLADGASSFTSYDVFINFDDGTNTISGANTIISGNIAGAPSDLLDTDSNTTGISLQAYTLTTAMTSGKATDSTCFDTDTDYGLKALNNGGGQPDGFYITLPTGTFTIKVLSSYLYATGLPITHTLTGESDFVIYAGTDSVDHCGEWTGVTGGSQLLYTFDNIENAASILNAMKITKTA